MLRFIRRKERNIFVHPAREAGGVCQVAENGWRCAASYPGDPNVDHFDPKAPE